MTMSATTEIIPGEVLCILRQRATIHMYNLETQGCFPPGPDPVRFEKICIDTPKSDYMEIQILVWQFTKKSSIRVSVNPTPMSLDDLECLSSLLEFAIECVRFIEKHA